MKALDFLPIRILLRASRAVHNPFERSRPYQVPRRGDAANDFARISSDMRRVGTDLRQVAEKELSQHVCR